MIAERSHAIVVLKGASTVIAAPGGAAAILAQGNPGMATGGTGDVLAGIIGGLLATGVPPLLAARAGAYLHGVAGDLAKDAVGEPSLIASDLLAALPAAIAGLRKGP